MTQITTSNLGGSGGDYSSFKLADGRNAILLTDADLYKLLVEHGVTDTPQDAGHRALLERLHKKLAEADHA